MTRLTKKSAQQMLKITDDSHVGDIARLPELRDEHDTTHIRLERAGYIALAGDRYVLTAKSLYR